MRYRLRPLLIVLALVPPLLAIGGVKWQEYREYLADKHRREKTQRTVPAVADSGTVPDRCSRYA